MEFFLAKIKNHKLMVHFEIVPSIMPDELKEMLARFPPDTLRLEAGIQTLNPKVAARISRISNPEKELDVLQFLYEKTNAIIHADLIAGLPGEDFDSFGRGFDILWEALSFENENVSQKETFHKRVEIQVGILKQLPGAPISRHNSEYKMKYNPRPPYEVMETGALSAAELARIKNFARFWEIIVNRGLKNYQNQTKIFNEFMVLSDYLYKKFKRNWGIDKNELIEAISEKNAEIMD
jgi:radical SAM superfamily enzyme YgiQ (UPF0313 family)